MSKKTALLVPFISLACAAGAAPGHLAGQFFKPKPKQPEPPTSVTIEAKAPSLAPIQGTDLTQSHGGLRISLQLETYRSETMMRERKRQVSPGLIAMQPDPRAIYLETTYIPVTRIKPDHLVFHIHISNQLPRVFRGAGILVQFNVAGKVVNVDPSGYGDLANIIIPPRGEQDVNIIGPDVASIPSPSTHRCSFSTIVVSNMDQASNVTNKTNFEWYYSYQTQTEQNEVSVPAPTRGWEIPPQ